MKYIKSNRYRFLTLMLLIGASCGSYKSSPAIQNEDEFANLSSTLKPNDRIRITFKSEKTFDMRFKEADSELLKGTTTVSRDLTREEVFMLKDIKSIARWRTNTGQTAALATGVGLIVLTLFSVALVNQSGYGWYGPL